MIVYFLVEKDLYKLSMFANHVRINKDMLFNDITELMNLITRVQNLMYLRIINIQIIDLSHLNTIQQNNTYMVVINNEFQKISFNTPEFDYNYQPNFVKIHSEGSEYFDPNILYTYENLCECKNKDEYLIDNMYDQVDRVEFDSGYVCMLKSVN
jgi:hypothetical protein